jgi:FkbM family methyltransferase
VKEWKHARMSWSQFGEDVTAHSILEICGYSSPMWYVDVGCYHPVIYSNTIFFKKLGWRGINIDPNPATIDAFLQERPDDINLCLAISEDHQERELLLFNHSGICGTSVLHSSGAENKSKLGEDSCRTIKVQTDRLDTILAKWWDAGCAFGLLTIDVEGHEIETLRSNDWNLYRPWVVIVEDHNPAESEINEFLAAQRYLMVGMCSFSKIFVIKEKWPIIQ